ncbi:MAG TPA: ABC transporter permease [Arachidicoccus sp.]|nr:ABC transporter permease [Arachidicoccus sp.]
MWRHYIITAWRSLKRNKLFTSLNIFGLAIGMTGAILIALLIQNMLSYDRFHKDEDRLYMVNSLDQFDGQLRAWSQTPKMLGSYLDMELPEVESMTRIDRGEGLLFIKGETKIREEGSIVDPGFFYMFNFPLVSGQVDKNWKNGQGLIITENFAKTLFGSGNAVGQTVKVDSAKYLTVSAVIRNFPSNTDFKAPFFVSWEYARSIGELDSSWGNNSVRTYIKLAAGVNKAEFEHKLLGFAARHAPDLTTKNVIQPLKDTYLYNMEENGKFVTGRILLLRFLFLFAILFLVIACVNFMNLSTARTEKRAKEVGVKKVIGATKSKLIAQFLLESIMVALLSFLLALGIARLLLPAFNRLLDQQLTFSFGWLRWLCGVGIAVFTGMMAGAYPALYLSGFKPAVVLKGTFSRVTRKFNLRSVLVVLQFSVAIILILSTIMITQNLRYGQQRERGYSGNGLAYSFLEGNLIRNYIPLKNALLASGAVTSVSKNMSPITRQMSNGWGFSWPGSTPEDDQTLFVRYSSDADLVKTVGMQLVQGRDIDIYKNAGDSNAVLLNEAAATAMRLKDPVGTIIKDNNVAYQVVGVVKDFIIDMPFDKVKPLVVEGPNSWFNVIQYKLNPNRSTADNLVVIKSLFDRYNPNYPFEYKFANDAYAAKFRETKQYGQLSMIFAGVTIFISCLGLFGLITFMAETKTKEIGIRKILGSSIGGIIGLLSKGFLKLILVSFLIAVPSSLLVMHLWNTSLSYHSAIRVWWFLVTALMTLLIVFVTVGFQAFKAATVNPVKSLRSE